MEVDAAGDTGDEVDAAAAAGIDNTGVSLALDASQCVEWG
jgi:hypothetical protein